MDDSFRWAVLVIGLALAIGLALSAGEEVLRDSAPVSDAYHVQPGQYWGRGAGVAYQRGGPPVVVRGEALYAPGTQAPRI